MKVATKGKIIISISSLNFKGATSNQKIFIFLVKKQGLCLAYCWRPIYSNLNNKYDTKRIKNA
jgi:hypothetical protein